MEIWLSPAEEVAHVVQPCELVNSIAALLDRSLLAAFTGVGLIVKAIACSLNYLAKFTQINPRKVAQGLVVRLPQDRANATPGAAFDHCMRSVSITGSWMPAAELATRFEYGF